MTGNKYVITFGLWLTVMFGAQAQKPVEYVDPFIGMSQWLDVGRSV